MDSEAEPRRRGEERGVSEKRADDHRFRGRIDRQLSRTPCEVRFYDKLSSLGIALVA